MPAMAGARSSSITTPRPRSAWLVVNPAAGHGDRTQSLQTAVGVLVQEGWSVSWHATRGKGHAAEIAARAARDGVDVVVVAGGDGTVNEVANGLVGTACALALLPAGTGNVLAAQLGLVGVPTPLHRPDPVSAARRLCGGRTRSVDVGHARARGVGGRCFVLWAGVGLDAEIVERVERADPSLKRTMGPAAYAAVGLRSLLGATATWALLRCDGASVRVSLLMTVVANVPLYAGTVRLAPEAVMDDGRLDVVAFTGRGAPDTLRHLAGLTTALTTGRAPAEDACPPTVAERVSVTTAGSLPVHLDAEPFGRTPFRAHVMPGALRLLIPEGAPDELFQRATDGPR